jgi:hypothetical protein
MITLFFTGRRSIVLGILSKGSKFNQVYFIDYIFSDLKRENLNFHRWIPQATFWVHMDNSMCHNWWKVASNSRNIMFQDYRTHPIPQT